MLNILVIVVCLGVGLTYGIYRDGGDVSSAGPWFVGVGLFCLWFAIVSWARGRVTLKRLDNFGEAVDRLTTGLATYRAESEAGEREEDMTDNVEAELRERQALAISVLAHPLHNTGLDIPIVKGGPPWPDLDPVVSPLVLVCPDGLDAVHIYAAHGDSWRRVYPSKLADGTTITISLPALSRYLEAILMSEQNGSGDLARASIRDTLDKIRDRAPRLEVVKRSIRV